MHLCTWPAKGGAGIAAARLVSGLRQANLNGFLVGLPVAHCDEEWIKTIEYGKGIKERLWRRLRNLQLKWCSGPGAEGFFHDRSPHGMSVLEVARTSQLVHLHWVCDFLDFPVFFQNLPSTIPLVWTLHDMAAFTGGCSYSNECDRYQSTCGQCPELGSDHLHDESFRSLRRRLDAFEEVRERVHLIAPSQWLLDRAQQSRLFRDLPGSMIHNGLDLEIYHPGLREKGRDRLEVSEERKMVLFCAADLSNPVKGMKYLIPALDAISSKMPEVCICCLGDSSGLEMDPAWKALGSVSSEAERAEIYAAADVLVVPSLAENSPNVICEAIASGVPVAGSEVGGVPELVVEGETGHLFPAKDAGAIERVLERMLSQSDKERVLWSERCRKFAQREFEIGRVVKAHQAIYGELLAKQSRP